jgi:signal transduction histidine kinase/ligand-binding sensor domain-containing protein
VKQIAARKAAMSILVLVRLSDLLIAIVSAIKYIWRRYWILLFAATFCPSALGVQSDRTIEHFAHTAWGADQGAPRIIYTITQSADDYLWIGAAEGLFRFDGLTFERYRTQPEPLPTGGVASLLALPDGDLWIGFNSGAISLLRNGRAVNYGKQDGVPAGFVTGLAQDQSGAIWAASLGGLVRLENNRWNEIGRDWNFPGRLARAIYLDRAGTLWVATENSLFFLSNGARRFQSTGIRFGEVAQIVESPNGKLWMAETTRSVRPVPLHTRLAPSDETEIRVGSVGILFTREGDLWITTIGDGLRHVSDPEKLEGKTAQFSSSIESYTAKGGLTSNIGASVFQDRDGNIWVGTQTGLDRFRKTPSVDLGGLARNPQVPPASIQSIVANGQSYLRSTELKLPAGTKNLQISYTAVSLEDPLRARFRYKLDGVDLQWQDASRRQTAYYTNLHPGKYQFHVIAGDLDGIWNFRAAVIDFMIPPFWYQTAWFRVFCGAVLLLLLWTIYQLHVRQLKRQFSLALEARVDERTRIARELHDTLIQSVDGLMLYLQAAIDEPDRERSRQMLEKALDRADEALLEGRERVHTLRTEAMSTNDLSQALTDYAKDRAQDHAINFSVTLIGNPRPLDPIVRDEAFRIGREALANAFQHSRASKIEAELTYDRNEIRLRIRDNGSGIDPQIAEIGKPGHWGLSGMRERANQLGGELNIWSRPNAGTEVDLTIPARVAFPRRFRIFPFSWIGSKASAERSQL